MSRCGSCRRGARSLRGRSRAADRRRHELPVSRYAAARPVIPPPTMTTCAVLLTTTGRRQLLDHRARRPRERAPARRSATSSVRTRGRVERRARAPRCRGRRGPRGGRRRSRRRRRRRRGPSAASSPELLEHVRADPRVRGASGVCHATPTAPAPRAARPRRLSREAGPDTGRPARGSARAGCGR